MNLIFELDMCKNWKVPTDKLDHLDSGLDRFTQRHASATQLKDLIFSLAERHYFYDNT